MQQLVQQGPPAGPIHDGEPLGTQGGSHCLSGGLPEEAAMTFPSLGSPRPSLLNFFVVLKDKKRVSENPNVPAHFKEKGTKKEKPETRGEGEAQKCF